MLPTSAAPNFRPHLKRLALVFLVAAAITAVGARLGAQPTSAASSRDVLIVLAVFAAALFASIAGFAFSALAGAMLAHLYDDPVEMVRILLLSSVAIQAYCTARVLKDIPWRELAAYLAGGFLTLPLGIFILMQMPAKQYALALGIFLVAYALYAFAKPVAIDMRRRSTLDACVGALGGITGGVAAFPGAFIVIWCSARGLAKEAQRAICQPYILVMQLAALAWLEYSYPGQSTDLAALWTILPVALLAAYCGFAVFERISVRQFKTVILALLGISGALLIAKGW